VIPTEPLPLNHSWPLFEASDRLHLLGRVPLLVGQAPLAHTDFTQACRRIYDPLAARGFGVWDCDLRDSRLTWSAGVYDLFGLPRGEAVSRKLALSLYCPDSRHAMEQLRAYAIKHRRGFTVDAEIRRPDGEHRWMRLSAMPVLDGGLVMRLRGTKIDVTDEYDSPRLQEDEAQH
jgi:PAS domain S-box-containing protein